MTAQHTAPAFTVRQSFRHVAGRGTVAAGWNVFDRAGRVAAGPYTGKAEAQGRADRLERDLERNVARGLDELAARRVANALGVELARRVRAIEHAIGLDNADHSRHVGNCS